MRRSSPFPLAALAALFVATPSLAQSEVQRDPPPEPEAKPSPAPDPQPPPPPLTDPPPPRTHSRSHFSASLEGGYGYQNLYGTRIGGVDVMAILGADLGGWGVGMTIEFDSGATVDGLSTTTTGLGPLLEGHFGRFRLGGGGRLGTFNVDRATTSGSLFTVSAGVFARASLDLITFDREDHGAVFLVAKASVDTVGTALYGATGGLGVRF